MDLGVVGRIVLVGLLVAVDRVVVGVVGRGVEGVVGLLVVVVAVSSSASMSK